MNRIGIYPKDIQLITGKSERACRETIRKIKEANNKESHQLVTLAECCTYLGISTEGVVELLKVRK